MALWALLFLLAIIILGKLVIFVSDLSKPWSADILTQKKYTWDSETSINIAIKSSEISVLNYDPLDKKIVVMKIPDDTYFDLPFSMGSWRAGAIYDLGQEAKPPVGSELLKASLSKLLGLPVDDFITIKGEDSQKPIDQTIDSLRGTPLKLIGFMKEIETDLTPLETFNILRDISTTRADKISVVDLSNSQLTENTLLPDSSQVLGIDNIKLDLFVRQEMEDPNFIQEGKTIAIFNATSHQGLALSASRMVTNLGGDVIFTSNATEDLSKSVVIGSQKSLTKQRLMEIFAPDCLREKCSSSDSKVSSSRADINIVLGEDYFKDF